MAEPIRVYCDDPEYPEAWIDIEARWTQGDLDRMLSVEGEEFYSFLRSKTLACNVPTVDGDAITDPAQLTPAGLVDVDVLLIGWLGAVLPWAVSKRRALGNASARLSLRPNGNGTMKTTIAAPITTLTT